MEVQNEAELASPYRIFHHRKEEKRSDVAKAEDVLVDGDEGLPQICGPPQDQIPPLICLNCQKTQTLGRQAGVAIIFPCLAKSIPDQDAIRCDFQFKFEFTLLSPIFPMDLVSFQSHLCPLGCSSGIN